MLTLKKKDLIRQLRSKGATFTEICDELGQVIPKSTLSYICKDVVLPVDYPDKMRVRVKQHMLKIQQLALVKNRVLNIKRLESIEDRAKKVVALRKADDNQKIHLAMLYAGEGSKYGSYRGLSMGSSDAMILRLYMSLLNRCYQKCGIDFRARVQYRADQDLDKLQEYWSAKLSIPLEHFYKSTPDKRTIGKPTRSDGYKGVCVVSCSGADIQLELAAIARLYASKIWGVSSFG